MAAVARLGWWSRGEDGIGVALLAISPLDLLVVGSRLCFLAQDAFLFFVFAF